MSRMEIYTFNPHQRLVSPAVQWEAYANEGTCGLIGFLSIGSVITTCTDHNAGSLAWKTVHALQEQIETTPDWTGGCRASSRLTFHELRVTGVV